jgi:uncharacterized protein (DUF302 family)
MLRVLALSLALIAPPLAAQTIGPREGWVVQPTPHGFDTLVERVRVAVEAAPIAIVTQASASDGAKAAGIAIPGNRVFGLFRNDYARRMLAASVAAGIEAPIVLYVTETADGTASLSWKTPSFVFAPYADEGGAPLAALAAELDAIFVGVATAAAMP